MPTAPWHRRAADHVRDAFTERLGYKAAALFFAVALWVAASGEETTEQLVPVRFVPVVDSGVRLVGDAPRVRALVSGPTRELLKLYADPPTVHRAFGIATPSEVHVELRPSDVDVPTGVLQVTVRDVQPRTLALRFSTTADQRAARP